MKRILAMALSLLLLSGCAGLGGDLDRVEVTFTAGAGAADTEAYSVVVTPTELTYSANGDEQTQELPDGAWTTLVTGLAALGSRTAAACPDGQVLELRALASGTVKKTLQASSCDTDGTLEKLQALVAQLVAQAK